jgi:hypothetical protein
MPLGYSTLMVSWDSLTLVICLGTSRLFKDFRWVVLLIEMNFDSAILFKYAQIQLELFAQTKLDLFAQTQLELLAHTHQ